MSNGRILVMDDEEIIQEVLSNMLDFLGYEVEIANDGVQAIEKYKQAAQSGKSFDVVIMDLTIPNGLGGKEAIQDLLALDSEVTAIVSSGYSNDPVVMNYTEYGFKGAISKPFKIEELKKVLQELV
ncbi:MAG TPA: response regulator [Deltaproteobacteria bacterium]|nr:response regulator [Deltaproteobacteria bacterium]HPJ92447.1 response regulator [Deltaproteobacteria bacterium]HPR50272.1 response regulator [Deltaproteobacteria bacterium]